MLTAASFAREQVGESEQCLTLNIFAPSESIDRQKLPVLVYIHGGAWDFESSSMVIFDATNLIRQSGGEFLVVTFNYRLNIFGFLASEKMELSGNYGLHDQRLALKWVQKSIDAFGGDPSRVTLMGESAGACSITYHITDPELPCRQAILLSGGGFTMQYESRAAHEAKFNKNCEHLGIEGNRMQKLREYPAIALVEKVQELNICWTAAVETGNGAIWGVHPDLALEMKEVLPKKVFFGTNGDEGTVHAQLLGIKDPAVREGLFSMFPDEVKHVLNTLYPTDPECHIKDRPSTAFLTDLLFRAPMLFTAKTLEDKGIPVRRINFQCTPPCWQKYDLGFFHTSEMPYSFGVNVLWDAGSAASECSNSLIAELSDIVTEKSQIPDAHSGRMLSATDNRIGHIDAMPWMSSEAKDLWFSVFQQLMQTTKPRVEQ